MISYLILIVLGIFLTLTPLLFHEMGHWAALKRYNVAVVEHWIGLGPALFKKGKLRIGALPIGGAVVPDPVAYQALSPRQRIVVALAGPAASAVYAVVALSAWLVNYQNIDSNALKMIGMLNLLIALLNIIPIPPLDGYQAYASWREHQKRPLSPRTQLLAQKLGSGLVYGGGFFVLTLTIFPFK